VERAGRARPPETWLDWREDLADLSALRQRLSAASPVLGVRAIPNARLLEAVRLLDWLAREEADGPQTLEGFRQACAAQDAEGVEPEALWSAADAHGYAAEIGYCGTGAQGEMDVLFRRREGLDAAETFWAQPRTGPLRAWTAYANDPLKAKLVRDLTP